MGTEECSDDQRIPSNTLETLRGILISSLSRENLGNIDVQASLSRRRKVTFQELHHADAGAAPVDANQRPSSAHSNARSSTTNKDSNLLDHAADSDDAETLDGTSSLDSITDPGKETSGLSQKEREERLKVLRDKQNEERQRKLEELKQQALAAQKFREQKEEERRRRIEELRQRDNDRRHQVEERKRQIWEAERDRREAILRKNQEREARIDSKRKNERSSIVFAFGSSTPRMLEPADTGGSFWGTRRATSTTNVMMFTAAPLTRRSSERELDGSKKRATSASGLDRKPGEDMKMSSSMYEVFHWNSSPEPTSKPTQRPKSLSSYAPGPEPKTTPDKSDPHRTASEVPTELNLNLDGRAHSFSSAPHTPSNRSVHIGSFLPGYGGFPGGEDGEASAGGSPVATISSQQRVNRRKTDLMPTIPSPRDLTPTSSSKPSSVLLQGNRPFSRSPGRAYSMSRLDQLAQPRRRPAAELAALHEKNPVPSTLGSSPTAAKSMSRSMSHLASGGTGSKNMQRGSQLRRSDATRSMSQLSGSGQGHSAPLPRMTRAERLRQRAREVAVRNMTGSTGQLQGLRSGEVTPSPPSRPLSALSQQSMNSVNSGVSLRARSAATSRRPRPISIAVTGVSHESDTQMTRTSHRHSIAGDIRTSKTQSSSVERENAKPPLPKVHSAKKPKSETPIKKSTDKVMKSAKASPRVTPKATPLQSPGAELPPSLPEDKVETKDQKDETSKKTEEVSPEKLPDDKPEQVTEAPKLASEEKQEPPLVIEAAAPAEEPPTAAAVVIEPLVVIETKSSVKEEEIQKPAEVEQKEDKPIEATTVQDETGAKVEGEEKSDQAEPEVDMSASMIEKIRNRTEEEAKAALAERRRLAREQAEREAELERQRLEEEKRLEEERLRQEEEEQRRFEEEQLRLVEEARKAEEERLLQAIEENERREEEERKRREEEARAKAEKEEAERKAREEAEKLRREMDERLKKEEEERIARRKRVEAIMLRTRGKGSTPSNTPTKGEGDNEDGKEESPMEETKSHPGEEAAASGQTEQPSSNVVPPAQSSLPTASENVSTGNGQVSQSLLTDTFSSNIMDHIQENGGSEKKVSSSSSSDLLLIDNSNNIKAMETSEDLITSATSMLPSPQQSNGHRNGVEYGAVDFVSVDNVKQNNATNNLLDLSEFDAFSTNNVMMNATQPPTAATDFEQILDLGSVPTTGKLSNEDNVNSNVMNNGPAPPFIAFQDNLAKKTDTNSVTDLLS